MEDSLVTLRDWAIHYGIRIIGAIIVFVIGRWVAGFVKRLVTKMLNRKQVDQMVIAFVANLVFILLMVFVIIAALELVGIKTASFVVVIGAAGLAIGLALQGALANFAAGFLIVIFRPFKKGDFIEGAGTYGVVEEIQVFCTILKTPDNKRVIIPNGKLTSDNIINYTVTGTRRVEVIAGVSYGDDLDKVRRVLQTIVDADDRILDDPASMIVVKELGSSSVDFAVRVWVKTDDYWSVYFDTTEKIKKAFDAEGISIPFPQRDVHIYETKSG